MGHSSGVEPACRVLPIIDEESESEMGEMSSPERKVDERRNAIVSRMRELLRRAAAQSSAKSKLRSTVLVSTKKWKRVVVSLQNSRIASARKHEQQQMMMSRQSDGGMSSSPVSSKSNSFSWDIAGAGEESCSSSPAQSPLWPAFRQFSPSPATTHGAAMRLRRDSSGSADDRMSLSCSGSLDGDDYGGSSRMWQWITTDCDFVVLEL